MRILLEELLDDLVYVEGRIKAVNAKVEAYAGEHEAVSRLVAVPGIGGHGATALVAAAGDGRQFKKARNLAAWLGLVPAEHSAGGKQTFLGIQTRKSLRAAADHPRCEVMPFASELRKPRPRTPALRSGGTNAP